MRLAPVKAAVWQENERFIDMEMAGGVDKHTRQVADKQWEYRTMGALSGTQLTVAGGNMGSRWCGLAKVDV